MPAPSLPRIPGRLDVGAVTVEAGPSAGVFTGGSYWLGVSAAAVFAERLEVSWEWGRDWVRWKSFPYPWAEEHLPSFFAGLTVGIHIPLAEAGDGFDLWGW